MPAGGQLPGGFNGTYTGPVVFNGPLNITDTTNSTSIGTGALIVAGGVSVGNALRVAGIGVFSSTITATALNSTNASNASFTTGSTGAAVSRNQADANPALKVNLANAGATGNIIEFQAAGATKAAVDKSGAFVFPVFTVATLPAGSNGMRALVSDALAPAFLAAVVGGGAVTTPVFHDGTSWKVG